MNIYVLRTNEKYCRPASSYSFVYISTINSYYVGALSFYQAEAL